jgi:hypothetical protein
MAAYEKWLKRVNKVGLAAWQPMALLGLIGISIVVMLASAVTGARWLFAVSLVFGILIDQVADAVVLVRRLLETAQLGLVSRSILREFALLLVLTRLSLPESEVLWGAAAVFLVILGRSLVIVADSQATVLQMPKVLTRNLSIPAVDASMPMPQLGTPILTLIGSLPLVVGGIPSIYSDTVVPLLVVTGSYLVFAAGWTILRVTTWMRANRRYGRGKVIASASAEVARLRPEVLVYFSGEAEALYQLEMWLRVLERVDRPVLIVLRERANLAALAPTTLPVVCVPNPNDLMDLRLPTVRVALYVAHVGKNIHMLREPRMKHVFIGHGESDKTASVNPVTKGFDEVWVAGRASRLRWAGAKVGVREDAIVEVGRPQLGGIRQAEPRQGRPLSVLYAPTWEGWVDDPYASSMLTMGPQMVEWLISRPDTRVIYRPHPFIGKVSARARAAHAELLSMITGSGGRNLSLGLASETDWAAAEALNMVVDSDQAPIYDCFNHCDVLIGDISSVVPDFQASGKPYLIPNTRSLDHEELRADSASSRAAYLLDPDPAGWETLLSTACGPDPMQAERHQMREFLLGPRFEDPIEPWRLALASLIRRANAEWPDAEVEAAAGFDD